MIAQVRIYTIKEGMMDGWVKLFNEKLAPYQAKHGINLIGAWVNEGQNEFVWLRTFEDEADRDAKLKAYFESPERMAVGDEPKKYVLKGDVRDVVDVFNPVALSV
jgi:hypothetical protein